jgi:hypothetical protein
MAQVKIQRDAFSTTNLVVIYFPSIQALMLLSSGWVFGEITFSNSPFSLRRNF